MKKLLFLLFLGLSALNLDAQVQRTITLTASGSLSQQIPANECPDIAGLTLVGRLDARDFRWLRRMPQLSSLDLKNAVIDAYSGLEGTDTTKITTYPANALPQNAFVANTTTGAGIPLSSVVLPENLEGIGASAFSQCKLLTTITVPMQVKSIGYRAFYNCTALKTVQIQSSTTSLDATAFAGCTAVTTALAPINAFSASTKLTIFEFSNGISTIPSYSFNGKTTLTSVLIPESVVSIGYNAFYGCVGLRNITLPSQLVKISNQSFANCTNLSGLTITAKVNVIEDMAFFGLKGPLRVEPENPNFIVEDSILYDIHKTRVLYCSDSKSGVLTLPSTLTRIEGSAFRSCSKLTEVLIPSTVKYIGGCSFNDCSGLTSMVLPESLDTLDWSALAGCRNMTSLSVPANIKNVGGFVGFNPFSSCNALTTLTAPFTNLNETNLFSDCTKLTKLIVSDGVTSIRPNAFKGLSTVTEVVLPTSLLQIGNSAFTNCTALKTILIPASVRYIGDFAFQNCTLANIEVDSANTKFAYVDGFLMDASKTLLISSRGSRAGTCTIPTSVRVIGSAAFSRNIGLTSVVLPDSIRTIRDNAFAGCSGLTEIALPNSLDTIGQNAFASCTKLATLTLPTRLRYFGKLAFGSCTGLTTVTGESISSVQFGGSSKLSKAIVPDGVTQLRDSAFYNSNSLSTVILPASLRKIGASSFYGCSGMTSINLSDSISAIGDEAFEGCTNLKKLRLPDQLRSIGSMAFGYCSALDTLILPTNLTKIGASAFMYCNILKILVAPGNQAFSTVEDKLYDLDKTSLYYCPRSLTGVCTLPSTLTSIQPSAMRGCINLTAINLPASIRKIGDYAIMGCSNLTSVILPESLDSLGMYAFQSCIRMTSVTFPANISYIGTKAFFLCMQLATATTPFVNNSTDNAFVNCSKLKTILVPEGLEKIKNGAFSSFTQMTSIKLPASLKSIGAEAFYNCSGLTAINLPASVNSIGDAAFAYCSAIITVDSLNSRLLVEDGILYDIDKKTLYSCPTSKSGTLVLPESVRNIRKMAFGSCKKLTSIILPTSLDSLGSTAFYYCQGLIDLTLPSGIRYIGDSPFWGCSGLTTVTAPFAVQCNMFGGTEDFNNLFEFCSNIRSFTVPTSVTSIGKGGFRAMSYLTRINLPSTLTSIGELAFQYCSNLDSLYLPSSLREIGNSAFAYSPGTIIVDPLNPYFVSEKEVLYNIDKSEIIRVKPNVADTIRIASSVSSIKDYAFYGHTSLKAAFVPKSVTRLGIFAFDGCTMLTSLRLESTVPIQLKDSTRFFEPTNFRNCTLYVPATSLDAYKQAPIWREFKNILSDTDYGADVKASDFMGKVVCSQPQRGIWKFNGLNTDHAELSIFDIQGRLMFQKDIQEGESMDVTRLRKGLYVGMIRMNGVVCKLKLTTY